MILSDHPSLDAADREWLIENCRAWSARFDGYLIALEAGGDPFVIGRQADRTVEAIEASLRRAPDRIEIGHARSSAETATIGLRGSMKSQQRAPAK